MGPNGANYFEPYFGSLHPLIAIGLALCLAAPSLSLLRSWAGFEIYVASAKARGIRLSAVLATGFATAAIVADLVVGFPLDLNVPLPQSLVFYPVMGLMAEIAFHLLSLAILMYMLDRVFRAVTPEKLVWPCIIIASSLEPLFQVTVGSSGVTTLDRYVFLHVFAFNLAQLYVFRRFDFVSMYFLRLVYYFFWHIVWGYVRLEWAF